MSSPARTERDIDWSKPVRMTEAEYLDFEERAEEKHEFYDGVVRPLGRLIAMSGGSGEHSLIISNANGEIRSALKGRDCRVFDSNMRVKARGAKRYSYPDASVVCGEIEYDPDTSKRRAINNPTLIVEVLSETTQQFDRTAKLARYRDLPSFREYVLIDSGLVAVQVIFIDEDGTARFDLVDATRRAPCGCGRSTSRCRWRSCTAASSLQTVADLEAERGNYD